MLSTNMKRTVGIFHSGYANEGHMLSLVLMSHSQPPAPPALWKISTVEAKMSPNKRAENFEHAFDQEDVFGGWWRWKVWRRVNGLLKKERKVRVSEFGSMPSAGDRVETQFCETASKYQSCKRFGQEASKKVRWLSLADDCAILADDCAIFSTLTEA